MRGSLHNSSGKRRYQAVSPAIEANWPRLGLASAAMRDSIFETAFRPRHRFASSSASLVAACCIPKHGDGAIVPRGHGRQAEMPGVRRRISGYSSAVLSGKVFRFPADRAYKPAHCTFPYNLLLTPFSVLYAKRAPLNSPLLWRPAAIMRDRCDIADRANLDSGCLNRPYRRFSSWSGTLNIKIQLLQTKLLCRFDGRFGRDPRGVGRALARAFETRCS